VSIRWSRPRTRLASSGILIVLGIAVLPLSPASSNPLPAATYDISFDNGTPITLPGTFSLGAKSAEIENLPAPLVSAHVIGQGSAFAQMLYWFRVNGPVANVPVPINITGHVLVSAGNAVFQQSMIWGVAASLIGISFDGQLGPGLNQVDYQFGNVDCGPISVGPVPVPLPIPSCAATFQNQPIVLTLNTLTGADNEISMIASVNNQEAFAANFDALVDPVISFAPGFDATG